MNVQQLFKIWQDTFPGTRFVQRREIEVANKRGVKRVITEPGHYDGDCCNGSHYNFDKSPKPDHMVCAREQAWRNYVNGRENLN